ncbi:TPA: hypothetical protein ACS78D_004178, partial [Providencia alcalifaciens]
KYRINFTFQNNFKASLFNKFAGFLLFVHSRVKHNNALPACAVKVHHRDKATLTVTYNDNAETID